MLRKALPDYGGVYQIKNILNERVYIGSTINLQRRNKEHYNDLIKNKHCNKFLQRDVNKHGIENFIFDYFEVFNHKFCSKKYILQREQFYLDTLFTYKNKCNYYNICLTAGSSLGVKASEITKKKMSLLRIGKTSHMLGKKHSVETKQKLSNLLSHENHPMFGKISHMHGRKNPKVSELMKTLIGGQNYFSKTILAIENKSEYKFIKIFYSLADAARFYNIDAKQISKVLTGKNKTAKNGMLKFRYKNGSN